MVIIPDASVLLKLVLQHDDEPDSRHAFLNINATGLVPNQPHPQHIHGLPGGANSTSPTLAVDADGDGFIEVLEGAKTYGPIIQNLTSPPGTAPSGFPTAPNGTINFTQLYDLNNPPNVCGRGTSARIRQSG